MKTRFCPSPTGHMHLGNARTALFNALLAEGSKGIFLLRIEDTDAARSQRSLADELMHDLKWLHMFWQEGPEVGGKNEPYWQSQRQEIYDSYYEILMERKLVYPCFCSDDELAIQRKIQLAAGQPPRYSGTCRHLSSEQVQMQIDQGLKPTLRFKVLDGEAIIFEDLVKGQQVFQSDHIGDFIIRRADGSASFIFCNAIDDSLMGVTTAVRGDDHLTNTPRQLLILKALNLPMPQYGHIPLILGMDGAPLSKRNGSMSVSELRDNGFLPIAVLNYLSRLGHYYENQNWLSFEELAQQFDLKHCGTAPARFDSAQLLYWQKESVMRLDENAFWQWCGVETQAIVPHNKHRDFFDAVRGNILFPKDVLLWAQIFFNELRLDESITAMLKHASASYFDAALSLWPQADFKQFTQQLGQKLNLKGKALFEPLRLAITGVGHGPEMAHIERLLGENGIKKRLQQALELSKS